MPFRRHIRPYYCSVGYAALVFIAFRERGLPAATPVTHDLRYFAGPLHFDYRVNRDSPAEAASWQLSGFVGTRIGAKNAR